MVAKKRQELPAGGQGRLYVVGTPIGNLEDLSPRARRILGEVDGILCEDTRQTAHLLGAARIERVDGGDFSGRLTRLDHHASAATLEGVVLRIRNGEKLALVSDAGMPGVSDPGAALVSRVAQAGLPIEGVPGPSALTALVSVSGFEGAVYFRGFFPRENVKIREEMESLERAASPEIWVWFESPERIEKTLEGLAAAFPEWQGMVGKELTKIHEKFYRGSLADITSHIQSARSAGEVRGEWGIVLQVPKREGSRDENLASLSGEQFQALVLLLLGRGVPASQVAKELSHVFGISKNDTYRKVQEIVKTQEKSESSRE